MAGETEIANLAVMNCGKDSNIVSLTEGTPEANYCKNAIDKARRDVLRDYDWGYASVKRALSLSDAAPPIDFRFRYEFPNDAITIREIVRIDRTAPEPPWRIELDSKNRRTVVTDVDLAVFRFTLDITDFDLFDVSAQTAVISRLSWYICINLGLSRGVKSAILNEYNSLLNIAQAHEANQSGKEEQRQASWHEARG